MIDWSKQHCGVILASYAETISLMPDLKSLIENTFPDDPDSYIWDVKVHMLMPGQYPCIPNWHYDNVPRVDGKQDFSLVDEFKPMFLWVSGHPLPEFEEGVEISPETWFMFTQLDKHRGKKSERFCWRGFIRATHKDIAPQRGESIPAWRRHSQVYLDADNFHW